MKILLIRPPETHFGKSQGPSCGIPLGIASIAACLKQARHDVKICDFLVSRDFAVTPTSSGGQSYGVPWSLIKQKISAERPDIVGISNAFTTQFQNAVHAAELVKGINRKIFVVVGGAHPSASPEDFFEKTDSVDAVVAGEGERTFMELAESLQRSKNLTSVKGLIYKKDGGLRREPPREPVPDLDELPLPAYDLLDMEEYFSGKYRLLSSRPTFSYTGSERAVNLVTSRGCPYNCIFCSIHAVMGHRWRSNSPEYVLRHIKFLKENFDVRHIHFEDDNLTLSKARFDAILDGLSLFGKGISWDTPNGIRVDTLDGETLKKCRDTGCVYLIMGVESGDSHVLNSIIKKRLSLENVRSVSRICKKIKIDLEAFFVIGFPGETPASMKNTLRFALGLQLKYGVYPMMFMATPLPGTELHSLCLKKKYIDGAVAYERISSSILKDGLIETEDFKLSDVRRTFDSFIFFRACLTVINFPRFFLLNPALSLKRLKVLFMKLPFRLYFRNLIRYKFFVPPLTRQ